MIKRAALQFAFASTVAIGLAYASAFLPGDPPVWAGWLMAIAIPGLLAALMIMGAERGGRIGKLGLPIAAVFVIVAGGFALALALPAETAQTRLLLGLPVRAAVIMYGVGLLPLFILPLTYALTFEQHTLSEDDLNRLRSELRTVLPVEGGPAETVSR